MLTATVSEPVMPTSDILLMVLFPPPPMPNTLIFAFCLVTSSSSSSSIAVVFFGLSLKRRVSSDRSVACRNKDSIRPLAYKLLFKDSCSGKEILANTYWISQT